TIVIKSDIKGGTWEGAKENLKNKWTPLWVVNNMESNQNKGNQAVVKLGARWLSNDLLIDTKNITINKYYEPIIVKQGDLFEERLEINYGSAKAIESQSKISQPSEYSIKNIVKIKSLSYEEASLFEVFI